MLICDVVREVWGELGETEYLPEEDDSKVGVVLESGYVLVFEDSDGFWGYEASFSDGEVAGSSVGLAYVSDVRLAVQVLGAIEFWRSF